jgi:GxxExxY protein
MPDLLYKSEAYTIIGAAMEVHKQLGCGFLESVYQEALELEFIARNIPYLREAPITIEYKGKKLKKEFNSDFICYDCIILELKAVKELDPIHHAQVFNYLKATSFKLGLLINFGEESLVYKRLIK